MGTVERNRYKLQPVGTRHILGVPVTRVITHDRYTGRRYRLERRAVMLFTNFLQWYLERRPDMKFASRRNIARILSYLPPGMRAWCSYMPSGFATYHVHAPHRRRLKNGRKLDYITQAFFRHTLDAVNLRSRAYIMDWLAVGTLTSYAGNRRWLSLGGGSGQPVYDSFNELPASVRQTVSLMIVDQDEAVLKFAREIYTLNARIKSAVFRQMDALDAKQLGDVMKRHHPQIVDAMGLFEYLDNAHCVQLLRQVYAGLPSGGVMIFTNMWTKHPHLDVHQRALGWPGVIQRTIHEVLDLMRAADVPVSAQSVYHDSDNVYCVYKVEKL